MPFQNLEHMSVSLKLSQVTGTPTELKSYWQMIALIAVLLCKSLPSTMVSLGLFLQTAYTFYQKNYFRFLLRY